MKIGTYRLSRRILKNPFGPINHQNPPQVEFARARAVRWFKEINHMHRLLIPSPT
jgi:hypothetical protein